jgi:hypothetical protein
MMVPATSGSTNLVVDQLSRAVAAHLARYKGQSRMHTASDLRSYLDWCAPGGWSRSLRLGCMWSCGFGGCRRSVTCSRRRCPAGCRW